MPKLSRSFDQVIVIAGSDYPAHRDPTTVFVLIMADVETPKIMVGDDIAYRQRSP